MRTEDGRDLDEAIEDLEAENARLLRVVKQIDYFGAALLDREYEPHSYTITRLVHDARAALDTSDRPSGRTKGL